MTINLFENRRFFIGAISNLWKRYPFIISYSDLNKVNDLIVNLTDFIPNYRQLMVCGNVPRAIQFSMKKPRILDHSDLNILSDSLTSSFEEERVGTRPLQLIYFDATSEILKKILLPLKHGWFATSQLSYAEIGAIAEIYDFETIGDCTIYFLKPDNNGVIEERLFEKAERRSLEIASFIFQLKMSEIHLIGNAILREVENGKNMTQVEIKEIFDMDDATLKRVLYLLKAESKIDVKPYIIFTPEMVQRQLFQLIKFDGIILAAATQNQKVIGLAKNATVPFSISHLFSAVIASFTEVRKRFNFGENAQFMIELKDGRKILLILATEYEYIFFVDATKNIDFLTGEIIKLIL